MSKETITLDYPISYGDLKHLKEGDEVSITWRNAPEMNSSVTLIGKVKRYYDSGTLSVRVDSPWVSNVGLAWCRTGAPCVADVINRPDVNVTIPRPEPLHATAGAVLLGPQGEVAVGMAGVPEDPESRVPDWVISLPQWAIVYPYSGDTRYMPHEDSWVLRSWKPLHSAEVEWWVEDDELDIDEIDLDFA